MRIADITTTTKTSVNIVADDTTAYVVSYGDTICVHGAWQDKDGHDTTWRVELSQAAWIAVANHIHELTIPKEESDVV